MVVLFPLRHKFCLQGATTLQTCNLQPQLGFTFESTTLACGFCPEVHGLGFLLLSLHPKPYLEFRVRSTATFLLLGVSREDGNILCRGYIGIRFPNSLLRSSRCSELVVSYHMVSLCCCILLSSCSMSSLQPEKNNLKQRCSKGGVDGEFTGVLPDPQAPRGQVV